MRNTFSNAFIRHIEKKGLQDWDLLWWMLSVDTLVWVSSIYMKKDGTYLNLIVKGDIYILASRTFRQRRMFCLLFIGVAKYFSENRKIQNLFSFGVHLCNIKIR